jgi:DNA-directed RNA polymerase II subunit RPB1
MNLHVPQSEETRAELMQIAAVPRNIISPQANKPVMGIVQDTLCGVRKFTLRDCFMDRDFIQNILLWVPDWDGVLPPPAIMKPKQLWTGKQILSMCIPNGINLYRSSEPASSAPPEDNGMWIENGQIMFGTVDKKTVGTSQGGLIHVIYREKGAEVCRDWFSGVQKVVNYWLLHNGFSIGIGDTVPDKATMEAITGFIEVAKTEVNRVILLAQEDKLEPEPGMTIRESFESKVTRALNQARDSSGRSAERSLKADNNVKQMVVAGSKGSFINISQMSACVGQQVVEGKRVPFGFKFRTLPHFTKDDYSPEARGFVENSYLRGLTPQEFFFHAMAGREGLIDTAVKTAETGYIQRRLVKALEDVMVAYDGTVRNSLGDVVQFVYGEDGMDGAFIEEQVVDPIRLSDARFEARYRVDVMDDAWKFKEGVLRVDLAEPDAGIQRVLDLEYEQLKEDRERLRSFIFPNGDATVSLPVNIRRIVQNAQQIFHIDARKASDLPPSDIIQTVTELCDRLVVVRGTDRLSQEAQDNATQLFRIFLRSAFAVRRVIEEYRLNREAFEWVIGEVESKFNNSMVAPGEMCGTLAAQSIGEPATQMTLNTFHYAGVSSKNVTLGVPRLKEIINVAVNLKTPSTTVYLQPEIARDVNLAKEVQTKLSFTTLQTITASTQIFYDPDPSATVIEDDREFVEAFFAIPDEDVEANLNRQSPWLLRFELDRAKMLDKKLEMAYVAGKIAETFDQDLFVIWSEDNAEKLVIRCRALMPADGDKEEGDGEDDAEDIFLKQLESQMLGSIALGGVEGIDRVFMVEQKRSQLNEVGEYHTPTEWVLETDGINLRKVLCVDGVDSRRTMSNSCVEILEVLGIEAARASVLRELRNVIEFDGSKVNYRHLSMLTDIMTNRGSLMAITRHGINRSDTGALMRCSFEETVEILMEAAAAGETDYCTGVAENV